MVALNTIEDALVAHIVFDGPPHPHKTSNIERLCASLPPSRRTELFVAPGEDEDASPVLQYVRYNGGFIAGRPLNSILLGIPDPGTHTETRDFLLERADVLVYICTLESLEHGNDDLLTMLRERPAVIQLFSNKEDLELEAVRSRFSLPDELTIVPTDIDSGDGIREALVSAIRIAANEFRVRIRDGGPESLPDTEWASPQELMMLLGLIEEAGVNPLEEPQDEAESGAAEEEAAEETSSVVEVEAEAETEMEAVAQDAAEEVAEEEESAEERVVEGAAEADAEEHAEAEVAVEEAEPVAETEEAVAEAEVAEDVSAGMYAGHATAAQSVDDIFDEAEALLDGVETMVSTPTPPSPAEAIEPLLRQSSEFEVPKEFVRTNEKTKKVKRPKSIVEENIEAIPPAMRVLRQRARRSAMPAAAAAGGGLARPLGHGQQDESYDTVDIDLSELDDIISNAIDSELEPEEAAPLPPEWLSSHPDLEPVSAELAMVWKAAPPCGPFPPNFLWPEDAGEFVETIPFEKAVRRDDLVGQQGTSDGSARSDIQIYQAGEWCLKTSSRSRFKSRSQALRALVTLSRSKQRLKHWMPPGTIVAIQPDDKGFFWVWTITRWLSTLRGKLETAASANDEQAVGDALVSFADLLCESLARVSREGLLVDLSPSNFATDGQTYYYLDDDISTGRRIPVIGYALLQRVEEYKDFPNAVERYLDAFENTAIEELSSIEANMLRVIEFIRSTPVRSPIAQEARQRLARHLSKRRKRHT